MPDNRPPKTGGLRRRLQALSYSAARRLARTLATVVGGSYSRRYSPPGFSRGPKAHVIILDGTMSSLERGFETHVGITYRMLQEMGSQVSVFYEAGIQWRSWRSMGDVITGNGIDRQIRRAYGYLASRYRPGDRVYLMGYSRGAYAVRSLAGVIDMVGLLKPEHATVSNIRTVYRHYQLNPESTSAKAFARLYCLPQIPIEMVGVWDTVKALGLRLPLLWRLTEPRYSFHNHKLGPTVRNGFQALALDENRVVYQPVLWTSDEGWTGRVEQMWFRGSHGDIGGQLGGFEAARPLANISLVWMLDRAEGAGLPLPHGWRARFYTDVTAPSVGTWRGWGKLFLLRHRRIVGRDPTEHIHPSVHDHPAPRSWAEALHWGSRNAH
ncbi:DUF2235 domain-containing protein [Chachezhania sediminis]|uniref:DUF2235 domain-containing protein n=1 Tax=Chachezhania sediminis TaxID=2599291 RepID=UPI00131D9D74|nr:DUF2235 domain-containing protein [Chachezhania sediminis]